MFVSVARNVISFNVVKKNSPDPIVLVDDDGTVALTLRRTPDESHDNRRRPNAHTAHRSRK